MPRKVDMDNLWQYQDYTINATMIKSSMIREYDISKANINALLDGGYISQSYYDKLYGFSKYEREVTIGKLISGQPKAYDIIKSNITMARKKLIELNGIKPHEIVRIANDAIYVCRQLPLKTTKVSDHIEFICKNTYTTFMRLPNTIILFSGGNGISECDIDVIGISKEALLLHQNGMLPFLVFILKSLESNTIQCTIRNFNNVYSKYLNRQFNIDIYREFNSASMFKVSHTDNSVFYVAGSNSISLQDIDISYNAYYMRELYARLIEAYQGSVR